MVSRMTSILTNMTQDQLKAIERGLRRTFPSLRQISPIRLLGEGWGSIAVETSNQLVFRIAKSEIFAKQHRRQVKILPLIANSLPIKIPIPKYYSEPSDSFPLGVMGYKKIDGNVLTHSQVTTDTGAIARNVAELLLAIHTTSPPSNLPVIDYPGAPDQAQPLKNVWIQAVSWLSRNLSGSDFGLVSDQWQAIVRSHTEIVQQSVLVHGDPWYGNLLVDESGRLVGLVDFDKLHIGDPAIDFGVQEYAGMKFTKEVIRRYLQIGGYPGESLEQRIGIVMRIKALKDLAFCLQIGHIYEGTLEKIKRAF
jgi:aminoglycoside 2''-phosphotransferase